jgi:hypothetical protein
MCSRPGGGAASDGTLGLRRFQFGPLLPMFQRDENRTSGRARTELVQYAHQHATSWRLAYRDTRYGAEMSPCGLEHRLLLFAGEQDVEVLLFTGRCEHRPDDRSGVCWTTRDQGLGGGDSKMRACWVFRSL